MLPASTDDRDLLEHGQPRQLVVESDGVTRRHENAALQRLVESGSEVGRQVLHQAHLAPRSRHGHQVDHVPGRSGQPRHARQNRLSDTARKRGIGPASGRDDLADEERVPSGHPIERVGIRPGPVLVGGDPFLDQGADAVRSERVQVDPTYAGRPRHVAEQDPERMAAPGLLTPERHQDQHPEPVDATGEVPHQVERRVVRPVGVLDHHQVRRTRTTQGLGEPEEHVGPVRAFGPDAPGQVRQHLAEGAERSRGGRAVARATRHPGRRSGFRDHSVDERGLADTRLASDEDEPTVPLGGRGEVVPGAPQGGGALQQRHEGHGRDESAGQRMIECLASMGPRPR